jgi:DnaK suppressor protein
MKQKTSAAHKRKTSGARPPPASARPGVQSQKKATVVAAAKKPAPRRPVLKAAVAKKPAAAAKKPVVVAKTSPTAKPAAHRAPPKIAARPVAAPPPKSAVPTVGATAFKGDKRKFRDALIGLRNQMVSLVRNISASTLTSSKQAGEELADVGSDNFSREIGLALMTEDGRKLALIQEALDRLQSGTFGVCTDCGKAISEGRLGAIPYAPLCVDCQAAQELSEKLSAEGGADYDSFRGDWTQDGEETDLPRDEADDDEAADDADDEDEDLLDDVSAKNARAARKRAAHAAAAAGGGSAAAKGRAPVKASPPPRRP